MNASNFTNDSNIEMLYNASNNMILDKYKMNVGKNKLKEIIFKIVDVIAKDSNIINTKTLKELNKLTLVKVKEFIETNLKKIPPPSPKQVLTEPIPEIQENIPFEKNIINDDDLMNKMKSLEENRNIMNSLSINSLNGNNINYLHNDIDPDKTNNVEDIKLLLIELIGSKSTSTDTKEVKQQIKKDLFINSINRDWGFNKEINNLKLNIGIDIKNFYIELHKIFLPCYIKNDTPYINLVFADNTKSQNYNLVFNKTSGNWDEWISINNTVDTININSKNWKISLYDNMNNELHLYKDDIDIKEAMKDNNNFKLKLTDTYKYHNLKANDFIIIKTNDNKNHNKKIINIENDEITVSDIGIILEDFINSKIAVIKDQFSINLKYYPRLSY